MSHNKKEIIKFLILHNTKWQSSRLKNRERFKTIIICRINQTIPNKLFVVRQIIYDWERQSRIREGIDLLLFSTHVSACNGRIWKAVLSCWTIDVLGVYMSLLVVGWQLCCFAKSDTNFLLVSGHH